MIVCNECGFFLDEFDEEGFYYCPQCDTEQWFNSEI